MATGLAYSIRAIGLTQATRKMNRLGRGQVRIVTMTAIERTARIGEKRVKVRFSGDPFKVRSGLTRASIRTQLEPARLQARVGSPKHYMRALEEGATIRPIRAKYLTIPLDAARTAAGKSRGSARQVGARYQSTFIAKSRNGNLILFGKTGKRIVPLFVLKKRVILRGRHVFRDEALKLKAVGLHEITVELRKLAA